MPNETSVEEFIKLAIELERSAQAFYQGLEVKFARHPELAQFWHLYAQEEDGHAQILEDVLKNLSPMISELPARAMMVWIAQQCQQMFAKGDFDRVQNLDDAYELAHQLESNEVNSIFLFVVTSYAIDRDFSPARQQLLLHVDRLSSGFPAAYCTKESRVTILAE